MSIAALAPITPGHLKRIIELCGYKVIAEDDFNWVLDHDDDSNDEEPIILPKLGKWVALDVLMDTVFVKARMDLRKYLALRDRASSEGYATFIN